MKSSKRKIFEVVQLVVGKPSPITVASLQPGPAAFAGNMRVNIGNSQTA